MTLLNIDNREVTARFTYQQPDSNYCKVIDLAYGNCNRWVDQVLGW